MACSLLSNVFSLAKRLVEARGRNSGVARDVYATLNLTNQSDFHSGTMGDFAHPLRCPSGEGPEMSTCPRAVFFDVDGVLVDSLPQHLQICRDKAVEFGLKLKIPTVDEFRQLVRRGTKVSPMRYFFLAVGFPEDYAARAVADYQREFIQRYRPKAFPGVSEMLKTLQAAELKLGLVTSNTAPMYCLRLEMQCSTSRRAAFSSLTGIRNQKRSHGAWPKARAC